MAGRKISRANMARIQSIADHAHAMGAKHPGMLDYQSPAKSDMSLNDQLEVVARAVYGAAVSPMDGYCCIEETFADHVIIEVCQSGGAETYWRADYSLGSDGSATLAARDSWVQVEEVWTPVQSTVKAGSLLSDADPYAVYASIKALGDRTLELRVAWGWDGHKEQFVKGLTDFDLENYPTPPAAYYHGFTATGKKAPKPAYVGKSVKREDREDGHYITVKLNKKPEADRVWEAALKGEAVVSPGTAGHLIRKEPNGTLTYWPIVEISVWDYADSRKQAHPNSRAFPVLKALYQEAGIPLPPSIDTASDDSTPETAGDAVSAGDQVAVDPDAVVQVIAAQMANLRLALRKGQTTL